MSESERWQRIAESSTRWTDEQILDALRLVAESNGGACPVRVYRERRDELHWDIPTMVTVAQRFGGWTEALIAAGLPHDTSTPSGPRSDRMPESALLQAVRECADDLGHFPSVMDYDRWARQHGRPCQAIIRRRLGGWRGLKDKLGAWA